MDAERIKSLLSILGVSKISATDTKIKSSCPLAPWTHSSGRDAHPSFVVFIADHDESICKCMSAGCGFKGSLIKLIWTIEFRSRAKLDKLRNLVQQHDKVDFIARAERIKGNLGIFSTKKDYIPGTIQGGIDAADFVNIISKIPDRHHHDHFVDEMHAFLNDEALSYLVNKRRLSESAINSWRLGFHPGARRIAIPQYDRNHKLINIGGRHLPSIYDDPFWDPVPWMHAKGFEKEYYLFGEDRINTDGQAIYVLVEGMFDAIYLTDHGIPNVIAMLGSYLSKYQIMKILRWSKKLVIIPDGDPPGFQAADRIVNTLTSRIEVSVFDTPLGKDPDELEQEDLDKILTLIA